MRSHGKGWPATAGGGWPATTSLSVLRTRLHCEIRPSFCHELRSHGGISSRSRVQIHACGLTLQGIELWRLLSKSPPPVSWQNENMSDGLPAMEKALNTSCTALTRMEYGRVANSSSPPCCHLRLLRLKFSLSFIPWIHLLHYNASSSGNSVLIVIKNAGWSVKLKSCRLIRYGARKMFRTILILISFIILYDYFNL